MMSDGCVGFSKCKIITGPYFVLQSRTPASQPTTQTSKSKFETCDFVKTLGIGLICEIPCLYTSQHYTSSSETGLYIRYLLGIFWNLWSSYQFPVLILRPRSHRCRWRRPGVKSAETYLFHQGTCECGKLHRSLDPVFSSVEQGCGWTLRGSYQVFRIISGSRK